jgi:hypothetical protein
MNEDEVRLTNPKYTTRMRKGLVNRVRSLLHAGGGYATVAGKESPLTRESSPKYLPDSAIQDRASRSAEIVVLTTQQSRPPPQLRINVLIGKRYLRRRPNVPCHHLQPRTIHLGLTTEAESHDGARSFTVEASWTPKYTVCINLTGNAFPQTTIVGNFRSVVSLGSALHSIARLLRIR